MKTKITITAFLLLSAIATHASGFKFCPVNFGSIQIAQNGIYLDLTWQTMSEVNNAFFEIERSTDSVTYTQIGIVNGAGNSGSALNYSFTDSTANPSQNYYYRVKQVDYDGMHSFSMTTSYTGTTDLFWFEIESSVDVKVFPNPSTSNVTISWSKQVENIDFALYDLSGSQVARKSRINETEITIDLTNLSTGVYTYVLQTTSNILSTGKLTKK